MPRLSSCACQPHACIQQPHWRIATMTQSGWQATHSGHCASSACEICVIIAANSSDLSEIESDCSVLRTRVAHVLEVNFGLYPDQVPLETRIMVSSYIRSKHAWVG